MSINPASLPDIETMMNQRYLRPKNIVGSYNAKLLADLPESVRGHLRELVKNDWRVYCVDAARGYCHDSKVITIPIWAIDRDLSTKIWYICHEMSHAIVGAWHHHDQTFMKKLIEICPKEAIHHELGYKPRNARAAGIGVITMDDI
jgi:hypothetical protein